MLAEYLGLGLKNNIGHSLRLNAEVVARTWHILGSLVVGVKISLLVVILFFMCLLRNLKKNNGKKRTKSIQLLLCIGYCTDRLKLGNPRLLNQFLDGKLKHLEAR